MTASPRQMNKLKIPIVLGMIFLWGTTLYAYFNVPSIIPSHYDFSGTPDDYGSKNNLFILPGVATVFYLLSSKIDSWMINMLCILIESIFLYIVVMTYLITIGTFKSLGVWFAPVVIVFFLGLTVYYVTMEIRKARETNNN
jgi:hypothetical protein